MAIHWKSIGLGLVLGAAGHALHCGNTLFNRADAEERPLSVSQSGSPPQAIPDPALASVPRLEEPVVREICDSTSEVVTKNSASDESDAKPVEPVPDSRLVKIPTARELAILDFDQQIENIDKALSNELINPSKIALKPENRVEFRNLIREARRKINETDRLSQTAMWKALQERQPYAIPVPSSQDYPSLERRLTTENPPGSRFFRTRDDRGNDAYLLLNWGDSAEYDDARLRSGETSLEVIHELSSFLVNQK